MTGHNKRTCLYKKVVEKKRTAKAQTPRSIFVHTQKKSHTSPHVVDLKKNQRAQPKESPVYVEKQPSVEKRVALDLAAIVREANKKMKQSVQLQKGEKKEKRSSHAAQSHAATVQAPAKKIHKEEKSEKSEKDEEYRIVHKPERSVFRKAVKSAGQKIFGGVDGKGPMSVERGVAHVQRVQKYVHQVVEEPETVAEESVVSDRSQKKTPRRRPISTQIFSRLSYVSTQRLALSVMAVLLILVLPFPAIGYYHKVKDDSTRIVQESTNAFLSLQSSTVAAMQADVDQASYDLDAALSSFGAAQGVLDSGEYPALIYVSQMLPVIGREVEGRQALLNAGHSMALGNTYLVKGITEAKNQENMSVLSSHIKSALPQYEKALGELALVDERVIPAEYQQSFRDFKVLFAAFTGDLRDMSALIDMGHTMMGGDDFKRYLVLFQNHHELRPTGGFMGSFAIVDVQKGKIVNIEVPGGGTYDVQGQLTQYVKPPEPLQLVNKRWEFQDANWFPDFPTTAQKAEWFVENSMGITVDGTIAVNASVIERLLRVIGPIENAEHALLLDAENVLPEIQQKVEVDYDREENRPKAILSDLLNQLLEELSDVDEEVLIRLVGEAHQALEQQEVQIYVHDTDVQEQIENYGWAGTMKEVAVGQDYLRVIFTNLQGQKSDAKVDRTVTHNAVVQDDGSVIDTVRVTMTHAGIAGEQFYGGDNIGYLRVYVPEGSVLLDATGFTFPPEDIFKVPESWYADDPHLVAAEYEEGVHIKTGTRVTTEFHKTAFGNWTRVGPGETVDVTFTYQLPYDLIREDVSMQDQDAGSNAQRWKHIFAEEGAVASRYSILIQKQSGTESILHSTVEYPFGWIPQWKTDGNMELTSQGATYSTVLSRDVVYGIVAKKDLENR